MKNETAIFILLKSLTSHAFHPSRYFLLSSLLLDLSLRRVIVVHTLGLSLGPRETHRKRGHELSFSDPFNFPFTETNDSHFLLSSKSIRIIVAIRYRFGSFLSCASVVSNYADASLSLVSNFLLSLTLRNQASRIRVER